MKMQILQTSLFHRVTNRVTKKLHKNQKKRLDKAVQKIRANPKVGDVKTGELSGVRVYKFKMSDQSMLLAYTYKSKPARLILLALGTHENFYRDLKKSL